MPGDDRTCPFCHAHDTSPVESGYGGWAMRCLVCGAQGPAAADPTVAAVASRRAAAHYGLAVVRADIEDRPDNQTRFIAIAREAVPIERGTPARTMMSLRTADTPGALLRALTPLAEHGANIRRLESRPTGEPWTYRFYIEFDHEAGDPAADAVVRDIIANSRDARFLGTYPRWNPGRRGSVGWKRS